MKKITNKTAQKHSHAYTTHTHDHEIKHRKQYEVIIIEANYYNRIVTSKQAKRQAANSNNRTHEPKQSSHVHTHTHKQTQNSKQANN